MFPFQFAEVALKAGADRMTPLVEGGRREGKLTIYTSAQSSDLGPVVDAFEKKYGIDVDKVLQRTLAEAAAGRHDVEVIHFGHAQHRRELLLLVLSGDRLHFRGGVHHLHEVG